MNDNAHISAAFAHAAARHSQGEILFMFDRNIDSDIPEKVCEFIRENRFACKTSAAWFGMYYGLEPFDIALPSPSTGHCWNTQEEALPALEDLRRRHRDGGCGQPLHVVLIGTALILGHTNEDSGYPQTAKRELAQTASTMKDVTFDVVICEGVKPSSKQKPATAPHPLPLQDAGDGNKNLLPALMKALMPRMEAAAQQQTQIATAMADKVLEGAKGDVTLMKPLRVINRVYGKRFL